MTDIEQKTIEMVLEKLDTVCPYYSNDYEALHRAKKALRQVLEQSKQEIKHSAYAGVIIWIGDKRVAKLITETEIKYEREAGFVITEVAQSCLDELAKAKEQA